MHTTGASAGRWWRHNFRPSSSRRDRMAGLDCCDMRWQRHYLAGSQWIAAGWQRDDIANPVPNPNPYPNPNPTPHQVRSSTKISSRSGAMAFTKLQRDVADIYEQ
eukprot:scaffold2_cov29-Phaeocystis_antarctica.AAC.1